jgi:hypothetical protein
MVLILVNVLVLQRGNDILLFIIKIPHERIRVAAGKFIHFQNPCRKNFQADKIQKNNILLKPVLCEVPRLRTH